MRRAASFSRRQRTARLLVGVGVTAVTLLAPAPAAAIITGALDGDAHPPVVRIEPPANPDPPPPGPPYDFDYTKVPFSGVRVDVHRFTRAPSPVVVAFYFGTGHGAPPPGPQVLVTTHPDREPVLGTLAIDPDHSDPGRGPGCPWCSPEPPTVRDLAVIVLEESSGLPEPSRLDWGDRFMERFRAGEPEATVVGFGAGEYERSPAQGGMRGPWSERVDPDSIGIRRTAKWRLQALTDTVAKFDAGDHRPCHGDAGAPIFVPTARGEMVGAMIMSAPCLRTVFALRTDTPEFAAAVERLTEQAIRKQRGDAGSR